MWDSLSPRVFVGLFLVWTKSVDTLKQSQKALNLGRGNWNMQGFIDAVKKESTFKLWPVHLNCTLNCTHPADAQPILVYLLLSFQIGIKMNYEEIRQTMTTALYVLSAIFVLPPVWFVHSVQ